MQKTKTNLTDDSCLDGRFNDKFTAAWGRETDRVITGQIAFFTIFSFGCFDHDTCSFMAFRSLQLTGGAVQRALSPSKIFPLKSLSCSRDGSPSLDHSAEWTVFQPLLPAASSDQKKTEIAHADPKGHVNLAELRQGTTDFIFWLF